MVISNWYTLWSPVRRVGNVYWCIWPMAYHDTQQLCGEVLPCKTWLLGVVTLYNVIVTVWSFHGFLAELSSPDCH